MYSSTVATAAYYTFKELVYGAKFDIMYAENDDKTKTILDLDKLDSFTKVHLD
jgi:inward rectifier potassium channel